MLLFNNSSEASSRLNYLLLRLSFASFLILS
nr:MAG TPA: hypothetical protein [Caudoviricetes sp.]